MRISLNHPLRRLFANLVEHEIPWDREVAAYIANLLIEFVHVENLYRIRNCRGKRLEEVGEMLVESNPILDARSFEREREVTIRPSGCEWVNPTPSITAASAFAISSSRNPQRGSGIIKKCLSIAAYHVVSRVKPLRSPAVRLPDSYKSIN